MKRNAQFIRFFIVLNLIIIKCERVILVYHSPTNLKHSTIKLFRLFPWLRIGQRTLNCPHRKIKPCNIQPTTSKKKEEVENHSQPKQRGGSNSSRDKKNESNTKTKDEPEEVETWGSASLLVKDQVSNNNLETTSLNSLSKNNKVETKQMNPQGLGVSAILEEGKFDSNYKIKGKVTLPSKAAKDRNLNIKAERR